MHTVPKLIQNHRHLSRLTVSLTAQLTIYTFGLFRTDMIKERRLAIGNNLTNMLSKMNAPLLMYYIYITTVHKISLSINETVVFYGPFASSNNMWVANYGTITALNL